jgi:hypothetical protein
VLNGEVPPCNVRGLQLTSNHYEAEHEQSDKWFDFVHLS